ncbi:MAG: hypothetical protein ABII22_01725 [Candidatus Micrarchaeota archaeon]
MNEMDDFEKIFQTITSIIFGKRITGYKDYEKWLTRNVSNNDYGESVISKEKIYLPPFDFYMDIKHNIVTIEEAYGILGKKQLSEEKLNNLSFHNAKKDLQKLATTTPNTIYGDSSNMKECTFYYNSHSCYMGCALNKSKCCMYSFWPRYSEYALGGYYLFSSQFCIKCYNSENLVRCFEMSDCNNCSDSMFCHNCENLTNCMFCFNVKAKRYAICNVEVGKEKYLEIKQKIMDEMIKKLEQNKSIDINIFNIGVSR